MNANKTASEEARRQLHKNAACNLEQVLAATPHKTPTVRPPASYHENYSMYMSIFISNLNLTSWIKFFRSSALLTWHTVPATSRFWEVKVSTVLSTWCFFLLLIITLAPFSARRFAIAWPILKKKSKMIKKDKLCNQKILQAFFSNKTGIILGTIPIKWTQN